MIEHAVVSVFCVSRPGLLEAVTGRLFGLGCNLADTTFAVLSGSAELTAVCELPEGLARETLVIELQRLPELAGGKVTVTRFQPGARDAAGQRITHRFEFSGRDRPGLIHKLAEAFARCGATVVRLNAQASPRGEVVHHTIRFAVSIADQPGDPCLAAMTETARALGLDCRVETA